MKDGRARFVLLVWTWLLSAPICVSAQVIPAPDEPPEQSELTTTERATERRFELSCRHAVRNNSKQALAEVKVYIAVPPDTAAQTITNFVARVGDAVVKPSLRPDGFGQMIARITLRDLNPGEERAVVATWDAAMREPPKVVIDPAKLGTLAAIPKELTERFAKDVPGTYDAALPTIKQKAVELAKGKKNLLEVVQAFHDFVADRGIFTYQRGDGWDGAATVLKNRRGSCSEFAFLFSALCRAHGLPTRLIGATRYGNTFPYTDTVYHRWVEVYLPGYEWVPVDPTLDRGSPPKQSLFGSHGPRCLVMSRTDVGSTLGKQYISANTGGGGVSRERTITWKKTDADTAPEKPAVAPPATTPIKGTPQK